MLAHKKSYLDRYVQPDKASIKNKAEEQWPIPWWLIDTGMAGFMALLTVVDQGLTALFAGLREGIENYVYENFNVPKEYKPVATIFIGYPAPNIKKRSLKDRRKPKEQTIHYGSFGNQ